MDGRLVNQYEKSLPKNRGSWMSVIVSLTRFISIIQ